MRDAQARRKAPPQDFRIAAFESDRQGLIGTSRPSAADLAASLTPTRWFYGPEVADL
jgi:hypothetical protein